MRHFPATVRQRLVVAVTAGALGAGVLTSPLAWADIKHLRHQRVQAQHSVQHAQADLDESSALTRKAYALMTRSQAQLTSARHDLQVAQARAAAAGKRLTVVQGQLARAEATLSAAETNLAREAKAAAEQHDRLVHTVTSFYEDGDPQLVGALSLLGSSNPDDLTAKQANNSLVLDSQNQILNNLKATKVLMQVQTARAEKARNEVAAKKQEAKATYLVKHANALQAAAAKQRVLRGLKAHRWALKLAKRAEAHDRRVLAHSKHQEAHIGRLIQLAIARERARHGGFRGSTKGLLMRPVNGPITSPYGWRMNPVMHYWGLHDGDDFAASCGTPIWAAGSGTVMAEYFSYVWGHRLFLNLGAINGKNVTVIYNHLSAYRSHVGEHVARGQVVGLIGTTGWSTGCHTHMTVMVNGVAVNPAPWLGIG